MSRIAVASVLTECNQLGGSPIDMDWFQRYDLHIGEELLEIDSGVVGGALNFLEGCALLIGIPLCMVVFLQDYSASARFGLGLGVAIMPTGVLFTVAYCSIQQRDIRWAVFGKR